MKTPNRLETMLTHTAILRRIAETFRDVPNRPYCTVKRIHTAKIRHIRHIARASRKRNRRGR